MSNATIREGSREPLDFWLQLDTDRDGHPETPLVLTGFQSVELRVRTAGTATVRSFKTTDPSPQLTMVNDAGTATAPNGALASHVRFVPGPTDFKLVDVAYDLFLVVVESSGNPVAIPEYENMSLFVMEKF